MARAADPRISAGDLDQRVTLLAPEYNAEGDEITIWNPVITVWAHVEPNNAQEETASQRTVADTDIMIIIRYRSDIDARWRIEHRAAIYQIRGMVNIISRRDRLELLCRHAF